MSKSKALKKEFALLTLQFYVISLSLERNHFTCEFFYKSIELQNRVKDMESTVSKGLKLHVFLGGQGDSLEMLFLVFLTNTALY